MQIDDDRLSWDELLRRGRAVLACRKCALRKLPEGATRRGWTLDKDFFNPCHVCSGYLGKGQRAYVVHPALQACWKCRRKRPREAFEKHQWDLFTKSSTCKECVDRFTGDGPGSKRWMRAHGVDVVVLHRRVGRVEPVAPPATERFPEDNRDAFWRLIYQPEMPPGMAPSDPVVIKDYTIMTLGACTQIIANWHAWDPLDEAFDLVHAYRKRWAKFFIDEPPQPEYLTRHDIALRWGDACVVCGGPFEHVDHWIPVSAKGTHTLENLRPMCRKDNLRKGRRNPHPD